MLSVSVVIPSPPPCPRSSLVTLSVTLRLNFSLSLSSPCNPKNCSRYLTLHTLQRSKIFGYCCSVFKEKCFLVAATGNNLYHSRTELLLCCCLACMDRPASSDHWESQGAQSPSSTAFLHQCLTGKVKVAQLCSSTQAASASISAYI